MSILFCTFVIEKETNNQLTPKSRKGTKEYDNKSKKGQGHSNKKS